MADQQEERTLVQKLMSLGEERFAEVMDELLANERVSMTIGKAMIRTQSLKARLDKNVALALSIVNQPTREDYDKLRRQVRQIERRLDEIIEKLEAPAAPAATSKPAKPKSTAASKTGAAKKS